ncbi:unnamed protein product, partial [Staurois parvus]
MWHLWAGAINSNGTTPILEITTLLGTEVPPRAAIFEEVQGLLPCMSRGMGVHSHEAVLPALLKTQPAR